MNTEIVKSYAVPNDSKSKNVFANSILNNEKIKSAADEFDQYIETVFFKGDSFYASDGESDKLCYVIDSRYLLADEKVYPNEYSFTDDISNEIKSRKYGSVNADLPTESQIDYFRSRFKSTLYKRQVCYKYYVDSNDVYKKGGEDTVYDCDSPTYLYSCYDFKSPDKAFKPMMSYLLKGGYKCVFQTEKSNTLPKYFSLLIELYAQRCLKIGDDTIKINPDGFTDAYIKSEKVRKCIDDLTDGVYIIKHELLNCEKVRADIEPYEERMLTDPNRGHWDLWGMKKADSGCLQIPIGEEIYARNPANDINDDGVIAIDFGTKSTVVAYQTDTEYTLPMGIGDGNLSKSPSEKRFENPTIMQFVNTKKFVNEYKSAKGRPHTHWDDLIISHAASDKLDVSDSSEYYSFIYQIKQWAGQRSKKFRIKDISGNSFTLPPYLELADNSSVDPIEIYAYYIGLYINNMRKGHGIFLDYYLSFPVTYEKKVRNKIIGSFERGLKKSLPPDILNDEGIMKKFSVNGDISEPAAYAACVLQEYGFEPDENEDVMYAIFDFGGGTTDFDFGLWKGSPNPRYDYVLEHYGSGGDKYLGGENLLQMLSFEIFKQNQDKMRENGLCFTRPPKCKDFAGSDSIISNSQEAEMNMHFMAEKMRPFWEKPQESALEMIKELLSETSDRSKISTSDKNSAKTSTSDEDSAKTKIKEMPVTLFNRDGEQRTITLEYSIEFIYNYIERQIRDGVQNFFSRLTAVYGKIDKEPQSTCCNIFLAGNSSKSVFVKKVFDEEIKHFEQDVRDKNPQKDVKDLFKLYPPLGTDESNEIIKRESNSFEKPTGKTGVAFGLLMCKKGGNVKIVDYDIDDNEIPFSYYIGHKQRNYFKPFKCGATHLGKLDYGKWYSFIDASEDTFSLYYTTEPKCIEGNFDISSVKRKKCTIDVLLDDAYVYIRAISPHTLEYAVSKSENVDEDNLSEIQIIELGENNG